MFDREKVKEGVRLILEGVVENPKREGLLETPDRVAKMYEEIFGGMEMSAKEPLSKRFSAENNEMVLEKDALQNYLCALAREFNKMPKGYKALLKAVYVKRIPHEYLCKKYNASLSTVYRKLAKARRCFKNKVEALPADVFPQRILELFGNER